MEKKYVVIGGHTHFFPIGTIVTKQEPFGSERSLYVNEEGIPQIIKDKDVMEVSE